MRTIQWVEQFLCPKIAKFSHLHLFRGHPQSFHFREDHFEEMLRLQKHSWCNSTCFADLKICPFWRNSSACLAVTIQRHLQLQTKYFLIFSQLYYIYSDSFSVQGFPPSSLCDSQKSSEGVVLSTIKGESANARRKYGSSNMWCFLLLLSTVSVIVHFLESR